MKRLPGTKRLGRIKDALWRTVEAVPAKHTLQMAAALSYYFVISLFPALLLVSAIVAYLPGANPFAQVLSLMAGFVPQDSIELLRKVLATVVTPNRSTLLSFGILGTLWTASGGFAAAIEALDIAYEVEEARPFWVTRPLAVALTILVGVLLLIGMAVYPLDRGRALHRAGGGSAVFYRAEREAALLGHSARRRAGRGLLDRAFLCARHLLPQLRPLQQNIRGHGRGGGLDGLALLDQFFHAGGSGAELRTGQGNPPGQDQAG